jgi:phage shock protein PspC (stress-responsive transcriptional regulator)
MRRVITVSLNGNAFALDDDAAELLAAYLETAGRNLAGNPDRDEIVSDLEQSIGDKLARYLSPHKTVIAASELRAVLDEMGPVDGPESPSSDDTPMPPPRAARRLHRLPEDGRIAGVCAGVAAYLGLDPTIVRVLFVLLAFLTGTTLVIYLVLYLVLPEARTPEDVAAAHGEPFNARELVARAKREAEALSKHDWEASRDALKEDVRRSKDYLNTRWRRQRENLRNWRRTSSSTKSTLGRVLTALLLIPLMLVLTGLTIAWLASAFALLLTGTIFGLLLPTAIPIWLALIVLLILYFIVVAPIKFLAHLLSPGPAAIDRLTGTFDTVVGLVFTALCLYWLATHVPQIQSLFEHWSQSPKALTTT